MRRFIVSPIGDMWAVDMHAMDSQFGVGPFIRHYCICDRYEDAWEIADKLEAGSLV